MPDFMRKSAQGYIKKEVESKRSGIVCFEDEVEKRIGKMEDGTGFEPVALQFCKLFLWTAQAPVL